MEIGGEHTESKFLGCRCSGRRQAGFLDRGRRRLDGVLHVAIVANDRKTVDEFHRAALAAGATDNGPPGLRPHYHKSYYGVFVLDPDGHNIEAVCHAPA